MTSRIELPPRAMPAMGRAARRSALLAAFMRTLYGPLDDGEVVGLDFDALSDTFATLSATRSQLVAKPYLLRRLLAPLVLTHPSHRNWNPELRELVIVACRGLRRREEDNPGPLGFPEALERLREWGLNRYSAESHAASARDVRRALRPLDPEELLEATPSYVRNVGGVFTVSRCANVKAPLDAIGEVLNPINWSTMGEFFESVRRVGKPDERKDGWRGMFEEHFVVGWGPLSLSSYRAFLNVDFTFDGSRARADYSLAYEEDDQLEVDDGYLEAKTIPGRIGWCEYYAEKSTKFRSPGSNLIAPAILAVALESNLSSIEDAAYDRLEFLNAGKER